MPEFIFKYKYASLDPAKYPEARFKAFPIAEFGVKDSKIKKVRLILQQQPLASAWFHFEDVTLFKAGENTKRLAT